MAKDASTGSKSFRSSRVGSATDTYGSSSGSSSGVASSLDSLGYHDRRTAATWAPCRHSYGPAFDDSAVCVTSDSTLSHHYSSFTDWNLLGQSTLANVSLDKDNRIVEAFHSQLAVDSQCDEIVEALAKKLGQPGHVAEQVQNAFGSKWTADAWMWTPEDGSQAMITQRTEKLEDGWHLEVISSLVKERRKAMMSAVPAP